MAVVDLSGAALVRQIVAPSQTFQNYVTVEEDPSDTAVITRHPVDSGAVMSDHIYFMPPECRVRLGWSNADPASTGASYVRNIYAQLLALKNARQLFTVYTGKRVYNNMFIAELRGPVTDAKFEFSMIVDLLLQQVLLVNLSSTQTAVATGSAPTPIPANLANPQANQPSVSTGTPQTLPANAPSSVIPQQNATPAPQVGNPNSNNGGAGPAPVYFGM